jgi:hypothetical protein
MAVGFTLAVAPAMMAADAAKAKDDEKATPAVVVSAKQPETKADADQGKVALTGSYIKKDIHRNGVITDGANQVLVLDRKSIDESGASDLKQVLIRRGIH